VELLVLLAMSTSAARGPSKRPDELKEDEEWEDDDPLLLRRLALATYGLFFLAQVCRVRRGDLVLPF
jgi:hypothetical protein